MSTRIYNVYPELLWIFTFLTSVCEPCLRTERYEPTWSSLDARPLPQWYDQAKVGIFIHWGVFAVPSFGDTMKGASAAWFWWEWQGMRAQAEVDFMKKNYEPGFTYADFAPEFTAEMYDADAWSDLFKASGAKYIVFTSKHHEGFTNWPSKYSWNWNSADIGPHRDIVGELANSIRNRTNLKFGLYHSLFEWFNPLYLQDKEANFTKQDYINTKMIPEMVELVKEYKPEIVWSDGEWEALSQYWRSQEFLAWLYNDSPVKDTVVVNDRWGKDARCKHGGFLTCDDRYNPGVLQPKKWENCITIDRYAWGYRRNAHIQDYLTIHQLLTTLAETVSCGGNILINVGPTKDGRIMPIFEERLLQLGQWLRVNGEAIYSTKPWVHQNDIITPGVWYTQKSEGSKSSVYVIFLQWPKTAPNTPSILVLGSYAPRAGLKISMLGLENVEIPWRPHEGGIQVQLPALTVDTLPCQWAWVLKFSSDE